MDKGEKILVPLDGSKCAETIIPRVEELVTGKKTGICLLRVVSASTFPGVDPTEAQVKVVREAEEYGINGKAVTPYILARIVEITGGRSLRTNMALAQNNAYLAAAIAAQLCTIAQ